MKTVNGTQLVNWIKPTRAELEIEWKTEGIDCIWFSGYPSKDEQNQYKTHFLDNIDKFATVEKIDDSAINDQLYMTESVEQLEINIKHMRKDVRRIEDSIHTGKPTMPLFIRKNGELKILGGRTRCTVALMAEKKVIGLVIDRQRMDQVFYPLRKVDFLQKGWILSVLETQQVRNDIIAYIEGTNTSLPKFNNILGKCSEMDVQDEIEGIKKHLSYS